MFCTNKYYITMYCGALKEYQLFLCVYKDLPLYVLCVRRWTAHVVWGSQILLHVVCFICRLVFVNSLKPDCHLLTHKQLETHGCMLSTVATDGLVLKHQTISIHCADQISITLDQFQTKILQ